MKIRAGEGHRADRSENEREIPSPAIVQEQRDGRDDDPDLGGELTPLEVLRGLLVSGHGGFVGLCPLRRGLGLLGILLRHLDEPLLVLDARLEELHDRIRLELDHHLEQRLLRRVFLPLHRMHRGELLVEDRPTSFRLGESACSVASCVIMIRCFIRCAWYF